MRKILIVEDDLSIQALLHDFIQEAGYNVVLAADGVEALAKYSEQSFDLILLEFTFFISPVKQNRPCDYADEDGETVYDFTCFVEAYFAYTIDNPKLVTVAERDQALTTYKEEMQNYLNGLSEAEIAGDNIKKMLIDKSAELADSLSTENMKLSPCEIYMLAINDEGTEIIQ